MIKEAVHRILTRRAMNKDRSPVLRDEALRALKEVENRHRVKVSQYRKFIYLELCIYILNGCHVEEGLIS